MAEKIRPPHLPTGPALSQQPGVAPPSQTDAIQHGIAKGQQIPVLHGHIPSHPDVALHARPASSSVTGRATAISRTTSEFSAPPQFYKLLPFQSLQKRKTYFGFMSLSFCLSFLLQQVVFWGTLI